MLLKMNLEDYLLAQALGITKDINDRATALMNVGVDVVTFDSAHGHSKGVITALKALKKILKTYRLLQVISEQQRAQKLWQKQVQML